LQIRWWNKELTLWRVDTIPPEKVTEINNLHFKALKGVYLNGNLGYILFIFQYSFPKIVPLKALYFLSKYLFIKQKRLGRVRLFLPQNTSKKTNLSLNSQALINQ
jgi:hypothetical protein